MPINLASLASLNGNPAGRHELPGCSLLLQARWPILIAQGHSEEAGRVAWSRSAGLRLGGR